MQLRAFIHKISSLTKIKFFNRQAPNLFIKSQNNALKLQNRLSIRKRSIAIPHDSRKKSGLFTKDCFLRLFKIQIDELLYCVRTRQRNRIMTTEVIPVFTGS